MKTKNINLQFHYEVSESNCRNPVPDINYVTKRGKGEKLSEP